MKTIGTEKIQTIIDSREEDTNTKYNDDYILKKLKRCETRLYKYKDVLDENTLALIDERILDNIDVTTYDYPEVQILLSNMKILNTILYSF